MEHIKRFNEEFFGGNSADILLPKIDEITQKLSEIRGKIENGWSNDDVRKIETIHDFLIHNMDLDMLATSRRKSRELTGLQSPEKLKDKIKRTKSNW